MDTTLLLNISGVWERIDIYDDIDISVTYQELDVTNLSVRKTNYTKTFTVPATSNNSKLFEHYYEVNGLDFNPLTKIPAVVQYRGTDIFNGTLRMNSVTIGKNGAVDYEVYIIGDVGDFVSEIKNLTLRDLDYTDLLHELNYDNVFQSWYAKDNDVDGLFGGDIIYPLINDGLVYQGTGSTADWEYRFDTPTGFDNPLYPVPPTAFKPAIRLRSVIDRLFDKTNYTLQSEFFDTDYFKSIYMSMFNNGQIGLGTQTAEDQQNQNIFKAFSTPRNLLYEGNRTFAFPFSDLLPGGYDPLNNFYNTNFGTFQAPYQGTYYFNLRFNYQSHDLLQVAGNFNIVVMKGTDPSSLLTTGGIVYQSPHYELGIGFTGLKSGSPNLFFDVTMSPGEYIGIFIQEYNAYGAIGFSKPKGSYSILPYDDIGIVDNFIQYDLYNGPFLTGQNTVDVKSGIADFNSVEFLKDIIKLFNLVIVQNENDNTIDFIPYNWYFNESERNERDWTQKLDLNSNYLVEPLSFDLSKNINFQYTEATDEYLNKIWEDQNDYTFGRYRFVSSSNLLTGENDYEVNFAATPTTAVLNAPNFIIPAFYKEENSYKQLPYSSKAHIFFWVGNRYAYKDKNKQIEGEWYMLSGSTAVAQTTYPCVSHLSSLDVHIPDLVSDLSFGSTFDFFGNVNDQPVNFTKFNLYDTFWRNYVENNYSNETRRLTGKFFLKPTDVYYTKFTDKIFIKDSFYRLEKVTDASLIDNKLTQVSLIKERGGYYKVTPPAPFYFLEPNEPYPGVVSPTYFTGYTGSSITTVCDGTAPTRELLVFGSLPLTNLQEVWYDTGLMTFSPLPIGTYLRNTTDTTNYVVIDKQGRILEQDC